MAKIDTATTFANCKLADLEEIVGELQTMIAAKQQEEIAALRAKLEKDAAKLGYSLAQVVGPTRKQAVVRPKYRSPDGKTWSGRGIAPKWMPSDAKARDKYLIPESEHNAVNAALN